MAAGCDHGDLPANQIRCKRRQPVMLTLRPAIFDRDVLAIDKSGLVQPLSERVDKRRGTGSRCPSGETDRGYRRLLRTRSKRKGEPGTRNTADERSPVHH